MFLNSRFCISTLVLFVALLSSACGKKGPLTLPEPSQSENEMTETQASQTNPSDLRLISIQETK